MTDDLHGLIVAYIDVLIGRGLTPYTLAKTCGMNTGSFSRFRSRKYSPTLRVCNRIMQQLELRLELYDCLGVRVVAPATATEPAPGSAECSIDRVRKQLSGPDLASSPDGAAISHEEEQQ